MSILLSKHINQRLKASSAITDIVGSKIFYLGSRTEQTLPYIAFDYNTSADRDTKDGDLTEQCSVTVDVYAQTAEQMSVLATAIREALDRKRATYADSGFSVTESDYTSFSSDLSDDAFHAELTFNIETTKI